MLVICIYVAETKALISLRGYRGVDSHMQKAGFAQGTARTRSLFVRDFMGDFIDKMNLA